jgi:1-aminocyclopropane-1-carboxylate deaminase/D-cysteine desulfhydrase-like pyridoxal-dependent ACC family enzyme
MNGAHIYIHIVVLYFPLFRDTSGEDCYIVPLRGTDQTGTFGYIEQFNEIMEQVSKDILPAICMDMCTSTGLWCMTNQQGLEAISLLYRAVKFSIFLFSHLVS